MFDLTPRNIEILKIIVEEFLSSGDVLGSKALLKKYDLGVSSATIRNDMALLEKLELIYQPYNSAGRLPTTSGLRIYIDHLMKEMPSHFLSESGVNINRSDIKSTEDFIYNITKELSDRTQEIAFFISKDDSILEYLGVYNFLENNITILGDSIFLIIKMLESKHHFIKFIEGFPLRDGVSVFVGQENIIKFLKDYTIIVRPVSINGSIGYIGIIGGLKMNYAFNISALRGII